MVAEPSLRVAAVRAGRLEPRATPAAASDRRRPLEDEALHMEEGRGPVQPKTVRFCCLVFFRNRFLNFRIFGTYYKAVSAVQKDPFYLFLFLIFGFRFYFYTIHYPWNFLAFLSSYTEF